MTASHRIRIGHAVVASLAFLAIAFGNVASVRADGEVSSFESGGTADYSYTGGTTSSTLTTTTSPLAGFAVFGSSFFAPTGPFGADLTLSATSHTAAAPNTSTGGTQTGFAGTYTLNNFTGAGAPPPGSFITASFTNLTLTVILSGSGNSATLQGTVTLTDNFGAPVTPPETVSLSLSGLATTGSSGFGFANFVGNDTSTVSATIGTVPEPSTMAIAGLGALGMIGYGLRRRKAKGA